MTIHHLLKSSLVTAGSTLLVCSLSVFASTRSHDKPVWVISPERSGFISVVGYAPIQVTGGADAQRRVALMKARQQLGHIVRVRVENSIQEVQQVRNNETNLDVDSSIRLSSNAMLNMIDAEIAAQWVDTANGDLYILLELPEKISGNNRCC